MNDTEQLVSEVEDEEETKPTTEPEQTPKQDQITNKLEKMNISLSIWPPTQRTREAVTANLIKTLSSPSILSKRYGSLPEDEASSLARVIEEESFSAANSAAATKTTTAESDEADGIEILQIYSKEISKRMLDAVKAKAAAAAATTETTPAPVTSEEVSSVESESS